jgi:hypothetical protein
MLNPVATVDMERVRYFRMSLRLFFSIDHQGCLDILNSKGKFWSTDLRRRLPFVYAKNAPMAVKSKLIK